MARAAKHSTNYINTFISAADDCHVSQGTAPPEKPTIARLQYDLLMAKPSQLTSDDVLYEVYSQRNESPVSREEFFTRPMACLRASPLAKSYGWGFHFDANGVVTLIDSGSPEYRQAQQDKKLSQTKAMNSKRAK